METSRILKAFMTNDTDTEPTPPNFRKAFTDAMCAAWNESLGRHAVAADIYDRILETIPHDVNHLPIRANLLEAANRNRKRAASFAVADLHTTLSLLDHIRNQIKPEEGKAIDSEHILSAIKRADRAARDARGHISTGNL